MGSNIDEKPQIDLDRQTTQHNIWDETITRQDSHATKDLRINQRSYVQLSLSTHILSVESMGLLSILKKVKQKEKEVRLLMLWVMPPPSLSCPFLPSLSVCLSASLSLSLFHTHTHTHPSVSLCPPFSLCISALLSPFFSLAFSLSLSLSSALSLSLPIYY